MADNRLYRGLWRELEKDRERRIQEWAQSLDKDAAKYDSGDDWGQDDSEEFRWEHEYKRKAEVSAGHIYVPTNFADCYESEIMGRPNGWIERSER